MKVLLEHCWCQTHLIVTKTASSRKRDIADVRRTRRRCRFVQQQALCLASSLPTKTIRVTGGTIQLLLLPEVMKNGHHVYCTYMHVSTKIENVCERPLLGILAFVSRRCYSSVSGVPLYHSANSPVSSHLLSRNFDLKIEIRHLCLSAYPDSLYLSRLWNWREAPHHLTISAFANTFVLTLTQKWV